MPKNAIDLLRADHVKVRELLARLTDTTERAKKTREELLDEIADELHVHTTIEEEIFYPALRDAGDDETTTLIHEAREEHRAVDALVLPDLQDTEVDSTEFSGRAKVLKELVEHHADEEEELLFPQAEELFDEEELERLGAEMAARKQELEDA